MPMISNQLSATNPAQNAPEIATQAQKLCQMTLAQDVPQCLKQAALPSVFSAGASCFRRLSGSGVERRVSASCVLFRSLEGSVCSAFCFASRLASRPAASALIEFLPSFAMAPPAAVLQGVPALGAPLGATFALLVRRPRRPLFAERPVAEPVFSYA